MTAPLSVGSPQGVGSEGDQGCLCHTPMDATEVRLVNLPDTYEANTTYPIQLELRSPISVNDEGAQGGFRMTVSNGTVLFDNASQVHLLDGAWTHTETGIYQRTWSFNWTSPLENDSRAEFIVSGNAVNGNQAQTGDGWHQVQFVTVGAQYTGNAAPSSLIDGLGLADGIVLLIGILALIGLLWSAMKP